MSNAARLTDRILGETSGEHSGHIEPHGPCPLTGSIVTGSPTVFVNGLNAVRVGDVTEEFDCCCEGDTGTVAIGSSKVFINGRPASRKGDNIYSHTGSADIITGSETVFITS